MRGDRPTPRHESEQVTDVQASDEHAPGVFHERLSVAVSGDAVSLGGVDWADRLLTLDEAARLLSCTKAAVRKWIAQGRLRRVKVGRLTRVRAQDIAEVIERGLPEPPPLARGNGAVRRPAPGTAGL
jgi:excisionase family DNA binding protein